MITTKIENGPPLISISGWENFLDEGESFLKTAASAFQKEKAVFTPAILYNIIAMAIEKLVMALLMKHGALPYNHTMRDLVEALEITFPDEIKPYRQDMLALDAYQEICDVDSFSIEPPDINDIPAMLALAANLQTMVRDKTVNL